MSTKKAFPTLSLLQKMMVRCEFNRMFSETCDTAEDLFEYISNTAIIWTPLFAYMREMAGNRFERHGKMNGPVSLSFMEYDSRHLALVHAHDYLAWDLKLNATEAAVKGALELAWRDAVDEESLTMLVGRGLQGQALGTALIAARS